MQIHENDKKYIEVKQQDIPLSCPMPDMVTWNSHPRVYLEIEKTETKNIICPYCSTRYVLVD
jgi:uncharacterized Zn-finger protein